MLSLARHDLAPSLDDLLAGAERREPFANPDGRSTTAFERVWRDGERYIVKYVHPDDDFTMRVSDDVDLRAVRSWAAGLLDAAPALVDHAIVGAALGTGAGGRGGALLMRDVSDELWPADGSVLDADGHDRFLDHVAGFAAATWGFSGDDPSVAGAGLLPYERRWDWFGHDALEGERRLGWPERVPQVAAEGWVRFAERAPADVAALIDGLRRDAGPLVAALRATPACLLHGDIKASNTGRAGDGRTVLIDWAYVGEGPIAHDLAWHLALDRDRLPRSKEDTAARFRHALEGHGVDTAGWWDRQLGLGLLGATLEFGWEKAHGDDDELGWWCDAAREGARWL
jgi:hypothetical protein